MFLALSRFGIVCLNTLLEGDLKNALAHLLLACVLARAVSDTVWNSVLPLYRNLEPRFIRSDIRWGGALGLWSRKKLYSNQRPLSR